MPQKTSEQQQYSYKRIPQQQPSLKLYEKGKKVEGEAQFTRMQRKLHLIIDQEEQELSAPSVSYAGQNISNEQNRSDAVPQELKGINGNAKQIVDQYPTDRARRKAKTGLKAILDAMEREDEPPEQSISDTPTVILQKYKYKKYARRGTKSKPTHVKEKLSFLIDFYNDHDQVGSVSYYSESQDQSVRDNAQEESNRESLTQQQMPMKHPINQTAMPISNQQRLIFDQDYLPDRKIKQDERQAVYRVTYQRQANNQKSSPVILTGKKDQEVPNRQQVERNEQISQNKKNLRQSREQIQIIIPIAPNENHSKISSISPPYEKLEAQSNQQTAKQKIQSISSQVQPKRLQPVQESMPTYVPPNTGKKEATSAVNQGQSRILPSQESMPTYVPPNTGKKEATSAVNQGQSRIQPSQESMPTYVPPNTGKKEATSAVNQGQSRIQPAQESMPTYVPLKTGKNEATSAVNQTYVLPNKRVHIFSGQNVVGERNLKPFRAQNKKQLDKGEQHETPAMKMNEDLNLRENNRSVPEETIESPSIPTEGLEQYLNVKIVRDKNSLSLPAQQTPKRSRVTNPKQTIQFPNSVSRVPNKQVQFNVGRPINLYESAVLKLKEITKVLQTQFLSPISVDSLSAEMEDSKKVSIKNNSAYTPELKMYDPPGRNGVGHPVPIFESNKDNIKPHLLLKFKSNGNQKSLEDGGLSKVAHNLRTLGNDSYKIATTPIKSISVKLPQGDQQGFIQLKKVICDDDDNFLSKRMRTQGQFNGRYETEQSEDQYTNYDSINVHRKRENTDESYRTIQKRYKAYNPKDSVLLPRISRHPLHRYNEVPRRDIYEEEMFRQKIGQQRCLGSKELSPRMTDSTYLMKVCKLRQLRRIADDLSDYNQQLEQLY